jgi:hypothetical protein
MRTKSLLPATLLLLLGALPAAAQTVPLEIELGYRFAKVDGNMDEYRSQINEREGILIRNITWGTSDFGGKTGLVDHFRVDGSELGIGPAGSLRLEAGRTGIYNLRFFYRRAEAFSFLPDFANPLFPAVIPGQHTYNRVRNLYDAEVEILPGHVVTPIIGYTRNTYDGPGQTTYHLGQDEFRLSENLANKDEEFRLGAAFDVGPVNGRFIQGWRRFRENVNLNLAPGEKNGNNSDPVLGVNVNANSINRSTETKTDTPSTLAIVTGRIGPRIKLIGSYQRAHGEADTTESESASGSFVSFQISRFFAGLAETASTKSEATFWTGSGRAEFAITDAIDLSAGYSRRHRYMDGFALVTTLYSDTTTFAGGDPRKLITIALDANNAMDRFDDVFDTTLSVRGLGPFTLRGGWSRTTQDVTVTPDLSEIVVPGGQSGDFSRRIDSYRGGASYSVAGFTLAGDYIGDHADNPIVRTDYLDRDRYRFRLAWSTEPFLRISLNGQKSIAVNHDPGIDYSAKVWEYGGDLEFLPAKPVTIRFSASKYLAHTSIPIRVPQDFSVALSDHREDGVSLEGGVHLLLGPVSLDASYSHFNNGGSYPFVINRTRASAEVPVSAKMAFIAEWHRDKYDDALQNTGALGSYDANRYGFYVRLIP